MISIHHRYQLLDVLWEVQDKKGCIKTEDVDEISHQLGISKIELEGVISFYHFFHRDPCAKYTVYLNNNIICKINGFAKVKKAFETATGVLFEKKDPENLFQLRESSCIGLSDMEPAALINLRPFTDLNAQKVHQIVRDLKAGVDLDTICDDPKSIVHYKPAEGTAIFTRKYTRGTAIKKLKTLAPESVIDWVRMGKLTGLGGAFFPTFIKWDGCRRQKEKTKYVVCNADEGEPGTFKDRFLLRNYPGMVLEGMILCGYAIGAKEGVIYLRAEYKYLKKKIEDCIKYFRKQHYLGENILGIKGFDFDIRVQMGAGAYVCGEETALLQSMEGYRGEPRPKVYLPIERGFLGKPTIVNNVETFCGASRIIEFGVEHILSTGTANSPGTKLISISGDCSKPGIYEIEWGMKVKDLLHACGAENTMAVQVSGPSGELISADEFDRKISLDDLRCGGSFMIFNNERKILNIIQNFNRFFVDESCGVCTPCRAGNFILSRELRKIRRGLMDQEDLDKVRNWAKIMKYSSRCGLGQTAPNSMIQAFEKFPEYFEQFLAEDQGLNKFFDLEEAVQDYELTIQKNNQL
jgi:[NiFe] hydrogenase diaphorase moiety large subunit